MLEASKAATGDSSVVVSIQEILRLEAERLETERKFERERAALEGQRQEAEAAQRQDAEREAARQLEHAREKRAQEEMVAARWVAAREAELERERALLRRQFELEVASIARERPRVSARRSWGLALSGLVLAAAAFFGVRHYEHKLASMAAQHRGDLAALQELLVSQPRETPSPTVSGPDSHPSPAVEVPDRGVPQQLMRPGNPKTRSKPTENPSKPLRPGPRCPEGDPMCVEP